MRFRRADKDRGTDDDRGSGKKSAGGGEGARVPAVSSFWVTAFVGIASVMLVAVFVVLHAWVAKENANRMEELSSRTGKLVKDLGNRAAALEGQLREWGADPGLQEVLRNGGPADLRAWEEAMTGRIPGALKVRLRKKDFGPLEGSDSEALNYAGIDLIHAAERERRVMPLEVHKLGRPDVHLALAGPVLDERGSDVLGVVHVALPLSLLPSTAQVHGDGGSILFQQQVGDQVVTLSPERGGAVEMGPADYRADVPGTSLKVAGWVSRTGILDGELLFYAGLAYLLVLLPIGVVIWWSNHAFKRALVADYAGVVALVEDAVNHNPLRSPRTSLSDTRPVFEVLTRLLRTGEFVERASGRPAGSQNTGSSSHMEQLSGGKATAANRLGEIEVVESSAAAENRGNRGMRPDQVPAEVFRAYDIRGIVGVDLSPGLVTEIGRAVATAAAEAGDKTVVVARDSRPSSAGLSDALVTGLRSSGCDVVDMGLAPTPVLYFATRYQGATSGVMVTGSHNPAEYNGFKVVVGGQTLEAERVTALRECILNGTFVQGSGRYQKRYLIDEYIDRIEKDVAVARSLKLVVDCGNAAASVVAPLLYRALGCELVELNCDPAGGFPDGRVPDPSRPECLAPLKKRVLEEGADLGLAFDGDGDRLGVVDSSGKIIWADRLMMLLAADVLSRHPGTDVVFDVKCSHHLASEILRNGGRPVMWKSGHSPLKAKLQETGALLAGEWSGHIIFRERWYGFDDALYAGARLVEVLALDPRSSAEVFAALPEAPFSTPELFVQMAEGEPARVMREVLALADQLDGVEVNTVDGLRVESDRGWGLVRASNTQPVLVFRFEADDREEMDALRLRLRGLMAQAAPALELPF